MGWDKLIFMGHSASGRVVMSLAANFPDKAAGLIVLDSPLGALPPGAGDGAGGAGGATPAIRRPCSIRSRPRWRASPS